MKAVMMAVQNLTVAFGDLIVIILIPVLAALFDKQVTQQNCKTKKHTLKLIRSHGLVVSIAAL